MERPKPKFEEVCDELRVLINRQRGSWRLTSIPWEDAVQIIMLKAFLKYHQFDPNRGVFSHWASRLIRNEKINIVRDNHTIYSRPCIQSCVYNTGDNQCSRTPSGLQCAECPAYRDWQRRKQSHFNVKQTLSLENHTQEAHEQPSDFIDIEGSKKIIDREMKERLDKDEYRMYRMLYIKHMSEEAVGKALKYKKSGKMYHGYQIILNFRKKVIKLAKEIIEEQGLA